MGHRLIGTLPLEIDYIVSVVFKNTGHSDLISREESDYIMNRYNAFEKGGAVERLCFFWNTRDFRCKEERREFQGFINALEALLPKKEGGE